MVVKMAMGRPDRTCMDGMVHKLAVHQVLVLKNQQSRAPVHEAGTESIRFQCLCTSDTSVFNLLQ
jgi:hypothetical protein